VKIRSIAYWITTALTAFLFLFSGVVDAARLFSVDEVMAKLEYPGYLAVILGVWKVLGGVAVLIPKFPRLKEWAYAGMLFDLTGAAASHAACGHPVSEIATPLVILGIVMASWVLRPESRTLRDAAGTPIGLFPPKQPEARFETTN
jgi:uncharacterized membrane protein YphA (DoxX/SURF4 family)